MKTWFITGASRGFGVELARHALAQGDNVVATARRPETVEEELGACDRLLAVVLDVTVEAEAHAAIASARDRFGRIDVVVNNAGYGLIGTVEEISDAEARAVFDTNVFGTLNVTRAVLPVLREQGAGRIVNVTSMSGYGADAAGSLYSGTKFAVEGITEGLRKEVECFGIGVMAVEPGAFRTDFLAAASIVHGARHIEAYDAGQTGATRQWVNGTDHLQLGDPVKAVALIYEAVSAEVMPAYLPIGEDAVTLLDDKLQELADTVRPWRERSIATAHHEAATA